MLLLLLPFFDYILYISWYLPEGREPNSGDWGDHGRRCMGWILDGHAISELSEVGTRITGDTLLVLINAQFESILHNLFIFLKTIIICKIKISLREKKMLPSSCPLTQQESPGSCCCLLIDLSSTDSVPSMLAARTSCSKTTGTLHFHFYIFTFFYSFIMHNLLICFIL